MKVKENVTLFICEYCNKKLFRKHAMIKHESICNSNPKNFKACSDCFILKEVPHSYYMDNGDQGEKEVKTTKFHCPKLNKFMFPFKVERMGWDKKHECDFEGQVKMPNKCDHQVTNYSSSECFLWDD